jgi:hypothetical protein
VIIVILKDVPFYAAASSLVLFLDHKCGSLSVHGEEKTDNPTKIRRLFSPKSRQQA